MTTKTSNPRRSSPPAATPGIIPDSFDAACLGALRLALGTEPDNASAYDKYQALALAARSRLMADWLATEAKIRAKDAKRVNYLSLEFLTGRALQNAVLNLDIEGESRQVLRQLGMVLEDIYELEHDAGLGNGGLGRLAACFLDSLATLGIPGCGYGIRYEYGIFNQLIEDGRQVEQPDYWLFRGNPWETPRPEQICRVRFYGRVEHRIDHQGRLRSQWLGTEDVLALPYEILIPGFRNHQATALILWSARATDEFNLEYFNDGDYVRAVEAKNTSETISKVLYPKDHSHAGRELRLKQQYFFVSASLQRILNEFFQQHDNLEFLPDQTAIHLNDTHPAVAIPELMRILLDVYGLNWESSWDICRRTFSYTNHTILPEALETWPVDLFGQLLPRHLEIIYEINYRLLQEIATLQPGDMDLLRRLSLIEEEGGKKVRMANLAVVGSHSVNGVAALHSQLLKEQLFRDFHRLWPERFNNKTNGVTQRRWLYQANPALARLLCETIGESWITNLEHLRQLEARAEEQGFRDAWSALKQANKAVLADLIERRLGLAIDPQAMFDVQVKRIHEYKRQLLNILRVIALYLRLQDNPGDTSVPRVVILGGKAAPGYFMAKLIIQLAHDVGRVINRDPRTSSRLQLVFLPNYGVSLAERIFPASDLSEQISTAGMEASGTGNMKFALNGALTIGTLDGANIEIRDAVGEDNIFIFGLTEAEVRAWKEKGYSPMAIYQQNQELRRVLDLVGSGFFSAGEPERYRPLLDQLLGTDHFMVLADFAAYLAAQERVDACYRDTEAWTRRSILNVARIGFFSSDRTIRQYAEEIWHTPPLI